MGTYNTRIDDGKLVLGYERETFKRETTITSSEPASVDEHGLTFTIRVEPHGTWTTDLDVVTSLVGIGVRMSQTKYGRANRKAKPEHGSAPSMNGSPRRLASNATGSRSSRRTGGA